VGDCDVAARHGGLVWAQCLSRIGGAGAFLVSGGMDGRFGVRDSLGSTSSCTSQVGSMGGMSQWLSDLKTQVIALIGMD